MRMFWSDVEMNNNINIFSHTDTTVCAIVSRYIFLAKIFVFYTFAHEVVIQSVRIVYNTYQPMVPNSSRVVSII